MKRCSYWQLLGLKISLLLACWGEISTPQAQALEVNESSVSPDLVSHLKVPQPLALPVVQPLNLSNDQVPSVSSLKDVSPNDWAYEALRSLVQRYGCLVGYPNQTFRGDRSLTRSEFAAGLNACQNTLER